MRRITLTYFKPSGKYYTSDTLDQSNLPCSSIIDVFAEVRRLQRVGKLPGLTPGGGREFTILVTSDSFVPQIIPGIPQ